MQEFHIEGASCASCVGKIETALKEVQGMNAAEMNFAQRTVSVMGHVPASVLIKAIERIGYKAEYI